MEAAVKGITVCKALKRGRCIGKMNHENGIRNKPGLDGKTALIVVQKKK